ncbi:PsbP-related protein [Christiangramia sediminicola]|uniref:PsbP-related protein n=1 Tax=Christiangramia sediminicola TaxID=3073267 RepID=A0ABU1ENG5_9FLAO|nr:PsbP-related protein [Christiangramia sp. SM2212]MDR5589931.1 PsbP-related protein [Christiangramia sp. SM2212]
MKILLKLLILLSIISCSKNENTLKQFSNYEIEFQKQKIQYPNNEFSLFIPSGWEWKIEEYDNIKLAIDAVSQPDENGLVDIISIQKIKSFGDKKDLESEFKYCLELIENSHYDRSIVESGLTNILNQKSYFIHTKPNTENKGESEAISFILETDKEGIFYNLTASASQTKNIKKKMAIMIQSLETFKMKPD